MTTINRLIKAVPSSFNSSWIISWNNLAANDDGSVFENPGSNDRSVQVSGTFGGAIVHIEGSNDGTNFFVLTDPQGNALSISSPKLEAISELAIWIRPRVQGGDGTTNLTVSMAATGHVRG